MSVAPAGSIFHEGPHALLIRAPGQKTRTKKMSSRLRQEAFLVAVARGGWSASYDVCLGDEGGESESRCCASEQTASLHFAVDWR